MKNEVGKIVVCIVGIPGAGKTAIASRAIELLRTGGASATELTDHEFFESAADNPAYAGRIVRNPDGGFTMLDVEALQAEGIAYLCNAVNSCRSGVVFVTFARPDYARAFEQMNAAGVHPNLVIYLAVDVDSAVRRNRNRVSEGKSGFPEWWMRKYWLDDYLNQFSSIRDLRLVVIPNMVDGPESIRNAAQQIAKLAPAFSQPAQPTFDEVVCAEERIKPDADVQRWMDDGKHPYRCEKDGIVESMPAHLKRGCHGPWIVENSTKLRDVPMKEVS